MLMIQGSVLQFKKVYGAQLPLELYLLFVKMFRTAIDEARKVHR